ncbi:hypothetical protein [Breznakiella homolactica]|uniref:Uncharacterized protein n=1 Tax=Breznakiella homolactica TaxID=2798577 RepID=A0A7T7XLW1_9SPIR|nr:hypothetical protein [Breznakiella homolactica]QQO08789.1 hypothetical protein JFL75_17950 [Breznakiella homolactica]
MMTTTAKRQIMLNALRDEVYLETCFYEEDLEAEITACSDEGDVLLTLVLGISGTSPLYRLFPGERLGRIALSEGDKGYLFEKYFRKTVFEEILPALLAQAKRMPRPLGRKPVWMSEDAKTLRL